MNVETELKLSLTPGVASRLAKHPLLSDAVPSRERVITTYYDTPDLRLQREQVVLHYRKTGSGWFASVGKTASGDREDAGRTEWEVAGEPGDFEFSQVDDRGFRLWLESLSQDLQPAFTTSFTRSTWLLEPRTGVRIALALDRGWIVSEGRRQVICEIELELLSGSAGDLFSAVSALQSDLSLHPDASTNIQRGYRALADWSLRAVKALPARTHAGMTANAAFRTIALACLKHLQGNEPGVCESSHPEFVHQARVAIRRLRSAIRIWRSLLPEAFVSSFDPQWQTLAGKLGEARNWDVFLTETLPAIAAAFPESAENARLSNYAEQRCAINRDAARSALQSDDYSRLLLDFTAAVLALPDRDTRRLDAFAPTCLEKRAKRARRRAAETLPGDAAARHRLRVAYKRLRYALEFFAPLFPGEMLRHYHLSACALQDRLGRLNDLATAVSLTEEALPGESGETIRGWLEGQTRRLLPEIRGSLNDFQQHPVPWRDQ